ncbi:MAG: hypothetical protein Q6373_006965 [Candidatus Sigynarchaeota archaeon]
MGIQGNMMPYLFVDTGAMAGLAGLSMENWKATECMLPDFKLSPGQRGVARLVLARFVAIASAAQATRIVTIWNI